MNQAFPLVSAVMVTRNTGLRRELARLSAASLMAQTYPNKELIVVLDHDSPAFKGGQLVRVVRGKPGDKLGDLRNLGLKSSSGKYVVQWDDDDCRRKDAIQYQLGMLDATPNAHAACLSQQVRIDLLSKSFYISYCSVGHAGTILHERDGAPRYPSKAKSEDAAFWKSYWKIGHRTLLNEPMIHFRFYHGENTWSREWIMKKWDHGKIGQGLDQQPQRDTIEALIEKYRSRLGMNLR